MSKKIALSLTINGVQQNIKNINELESAIKEAEGQLKELTIGSEDFKKLSAEVKNAKDIVKDFGNTIQGQALDKRIGNFAKIGESITSSFALAQASISLFGAETEEVSKAAAKAQSILTIALTARSVAQGVVTLRTVATNIATIAQTKATIASTAATRALWAVLAANPLGAVLAAIGLIVTAVIALTKSSKEQIKISKELTKATSNEADALKNQLFILRDLNKFKNLQKKTIDELKKTYPGFNAFLDKENKLTKEGTEFLELKIKQYELEARAKIVVQKIAENNVRILEIENETLLDNISIWEMLWNIIKSGGNPSATIINNLNTAIENKRKRIAEVNEENQKWIDALTGIYNETDNVISQLGRFERKLNEQTTAEERARQAAKRKEDQLKAEQSAYKAGLNALTKYTEGLKEYTKVNQELEKALKRLSTINYEAKIIEDLKELQALRAQSIQVLTNLGNDYVSTINRLTEVPEETEFIKKFGTFRRLLEEEFDRGSNNFRKIAEELFNETDKLTQDQLVIIDSLVRGYDSVFDFIERTPGLKEFVLNLDGFTSALYENDESVENSLSGYRALQFAFADVAAEIGRFNKEITDEGNVIDLIYDPQKVKQSSDEFLKLLENSLLRPTEESLLKSQIKVAESQIRIQENIRSTFTEGSDEFNKTSVEIQRLKGEIDGLTLKLEKLGKDPSFKEFSDETTKAVSTIADSLTSGFIEVIKFEEGIISVNDEVNKLTDSLDDVNLSQALAGSIIDNIDVITKSITGLYTNAEKQNKEFIARISQDTEGLEKFRQDLLDKGIAAEKIRNDELLEAYKQYKLAELEFTAEIEGRKRELWIQGLQEFSFILSDISSLSNQAISTNLELLAAKQKQVLSQVVGDSEEANRKRIEIEEEYERKRKNIEKQGRLASLQLSLVQAISNGALAFTRALADFGPVAGPFLAAITASLTGVQLTLIRNQIQATQQLRRGGLVEMSRGGLLSGPSHEKGGIPLAAAGVIAEGQESVINRQSTVRYRDLLSQINQAGGGKPLVVNNFDDSRIVEAIAEQKQIPIRAFVLESEITNSQSVNKRLEQLSKL